MSLHPVHVPTREEVIRAYTKPTSKNLSLALLHVPPLAVLGRLRGEGPRKQAAKTVPRSNEATKTGEMASAGDPLSAQSASSTVAEGASN